GAIKLGPASDFETHFRDPSFEIELVSLDGECKEATVWFGELASCRRRATCLPEGVTWTDRDGNSDRPVSAGALSSWIFDPDPAPIRAGPLDSFATAQSLWRCTAGVDYLTGPSLVGSPFLSSFEVLESLPLDVKTLRRLVASKGIGTLEIKTRGVDVRPEALR